MKPLSETVLGLNRSEIECGLDGCVQHIQTNKENTDTDSHEN